MASLTRRRSRGAIEAWPGYVDVLSTLLMVIVFVLMVFIIGQLILSQALSGRDETMGRLNRQIAELSRVLALEKSSAEKMRLEMGQLTQALEGANEARDQAVQKSLAVESVIGDLEKSRVVNREAQDQIALLNQQIATLEKQLQSLMDTLDEAHEKNERQQVQISELGQKLNEALASKVAELARYRSEFFGRAREVLGNRKDIQIVGDRFVFQSEVLFASGSAELEQSGKEQLDQLATTLILLSKEIPEGLNWILRVDGHTDARPISTPFFASNWELSTARAVAVVKYLNNRGIPAEHLAATGFAEFLPLDPSNTEMAYRKNRRIELRFDQK